MKQLFMIFFAMFSLENIAAAATSKLNCERERYEFISLELEEWKAQGRLVDNFNGADLVCGQHVSSVKDPNFVGNGICVGIWNISFDRNGKDVDTIAKIDFTKTADGKITAEYEKNADRRGPHFVETVILNCTLEN